MIVQADAVRGQSFDVCIVGTGPAGLILALELSRLQPDRRILLLEYGYGGDEKNDLDDAIQIAMPKYHHPPEECTNKGLGGTSRTWGGRCVNYDEIDFLQRPIIGDDCTWNLDLYNQVEPFLKTSAGYFDCGEPEFDLGKIQHTGKRRISERFVEGDVTDTVLERWSLPTRFGDRYGDEVVARPNLFLLDGCKVTQIRAAAGVVKGVDAVDRRTGTDLSIQAGQYVIAAGAQESTRLLLKSPEVFETVGGKPKALGLYYQGHISGKIASVKFSGDPKQTDYSFIIDDGAYVRRRFQFPTEVLLRENLLNISIFLDNPLYYDPSHRNGTMSVIYLLMLMPVIGKRLAPPAIAASVTKGRVYKVGGHLRNIVLGIPSSLIEPLRIFLKRYLSKRKLPGVFLYSPHNEYALHFHGEQVPSVNNRMELADDGETLVLRYGYEDADVDSVIRAHRLLDEWLRKTNAGELVYWTTT